MRFALRSWLNFAFDVRRDGDHQQFGADGREAVVQSRCIVILGDGSGALGKDGAGVEAGVHFHDGDAGLRFTVQQSPLNGCGATILGEKRGVDIQAAESR